MNEPLRVSPLEIYQKVSSGKGNLKGRLHSVILCTELPALLMNQDIVCYRIFPKGGIAAGQAESLLEVGYKT